MTRRRRILPLLASIGFAATLLPATPARAACGNGLLETGESCESCRADCKVEACAAGKDSAAFDVELSTPAGKQASAVTVRLAYRSKLLGLPGSGSAPSVRERIQSETKPPVLIANDLGYAVRVVIAKGGGFGASPLLRIRFDRCAGSPTPSLSDLACVVEGCSGPSGAIEGCVCAVQVSRGSRS